MTLAPPPAPATKIKLTRADHGRHMTLDEFRDAETEEGLFIELAGGVVEVHTFSDEAGTVSEISGIGHGRIEDGLQLALAAYRLQHPGRINYTGTGSRAKLLIAPADSERHPDLSIYLTDPPPGNQPWADRTPDIVVEIVSDSSRQRDYVDKPADYWQAGVGEYWIVDPQWRQVQVCRRAEGDWAITVLRGEQALTTERLPEFTLTPNRVFGPAADGAGQNP